MFKFKLTTEYINFYNKRNKSHYIQTKIDNNPRYKFLSSGEIIKLEYKKYTTNIKRTLNKYPNCKIDELQKLRQNLTNIDAQLLQQYSINELYNDDVLNATKCVVNSMFYTNTDKDDLTYNFYIKQYINNLTKIGEKSNIGFAFNADFGISKQSNGLFGNSNGIASHMFIIKTIQDINFDDDLLHELMVGLYGTNRLRKAIPNFAYIYGGFKCSPPIFGKGNEVSDWCKQSRGVLGMNNENMVNYIIYENVNPSISINDFTKTCSVTDFLNIFLQILYALDYAHKTIDFTHYDLHSGNILLRIPDPNEPDKLYQILYKTENGWEYITTKYIPTFIDYGMSHCKNEALKKYENIDDLGVFNFLDLSVNPDRSWIMYDVYKILVSVYIDAFNNKNNPVIDVIEYIYKFFNYEDDIYKLIKEQVSLYHSIPCTEETYNLFTIDKLIQHIKSKYECDFISIFRNSEQLLKCEDLCIKKEDLYNKIIKV
jgi:hypothetical protein